MSTILSNTIPPFPSASMSRKLLKSVAKDGERRRSPRILALDFKENHQSRQLSRIRTNLKRKFDDSAFAQASKLTKQVWKGRDGSQNADTTAEFVEWRSVHESRMTIRENQKHVDDHAITNGKPSIMPAKHALELVLDTLQRRDTYEIFAEPVDPDEVDDYYEIIKEPMDFGTMRAKLHEGMYENLEQFEHDVYLIPENAMHFNSSSTIYFRQARAIHDLAKKGFHALKTDPENFVSEFSVTRRRSMRKALSETKDSRFPSYTKPGDIYSQQRPSTSTFQRMNRKSPAIADHFRARNFLTDGRLSWSAEVADRRLTYLYNDEISLDSTFHSRCKELVLMNQGDISYKDSLMSYVQDLGPTAQMVAMRKLQGQHESNKHWITTASISMAKEFKTFRDFAPAGINPFLKASNLIIDLTKEGEEEAILRDRRKDHDCTKGKEKVESDNDITKGKERTDMPKKVALTTTKNPLPAGRDMNCSTSKSNDKVRPVILALENSHSNVSELKSRIKRNCIVPKQPARTRPACDEAQQQQPPSLPPPLPMVPRFAFDLSFLKTRLSQMNASERGGQSRF